MLLNTRHFGEIEIEEEKILTFSEGLPGFEDIKKYILLSKEEENNPFRWLQSIDQPSLAFVVIDPFTIKKDYDIFLNDDILKSLEIENEEDVLVHSIVVVPEDVSKMSMNLKAPVIINKRKNKGMQVILDTDKYSVRHYILEELQGREVTSDAGTDKKEGAIDSNK